MQKLTLGELHQAITNSHFRRNHEVIDVMLSNLATTLAMYTQQDDDERFINILDGAVPKFQRDNDKWTEQRQTSFVENILKGLKTYITLYELRPNDSAMTGDAKILDGLQRLTALQKFLDGELQPFGYTHDELKTEGLLHKSLARITCSLYQFENEVDVIDFYIDINKDHSVEDIEKAKAYKKTLLNT